MSKWSNIYTALGLSSLATGNIAFWYTLLSLTGCEPTTLGPLPFWYGMDASVVLLTVGLLFARLAGTEILMEGVVEKKPESVYLPENSVVETTN